MNVLKTSLKDFKKDPSFFFVKILLAGVVALHFEFRVSTKNQIDYLRLENEAKNKRISELTIENALLKQKTETILSTLQNY